MGFSIEEGISPLVEVLNSLDFVRTVYSCEGHFDQPPNEKFLPTAYVTFGVSDIDKFLPLHSRLVELEKSLSPTDIRLSYDCINGRYTLSVWAEDSLNDPGRKRDVVDSAIKQVSDAILNHTSQNLEFAAQTNHGTGNPLPCEHEIAPCTLVIPSKPFCCPFIEAINKIQG